MTRTRFARRTGALVAMAATLAVAAPAMAQQIPVTDFARYA